MKLSAEAIKDFQDAYKAEFGISLNDHQANEAFLRFLRAMKIVYRPIPKNEKKNEKLYQNSK